MREQRISITRALTQTIQQRRQADELALRKRSSSEVRAINSAQITASKSSEANSIEQMNSLVEKIKQATAELTSESGDIGSENA